MEEEQLLVKKSKILLATQLLHPIVYHDEAHHWVHMGLTVMENGSVTHISQAYFDYNSQKSKGPLILVPLPCGGVLIHLSDLNNQSYNFFFQKSRFCSSKLQRLCLKCILLKNRVDLNQSVITIYTFRDVNVKNYIISAKKKIYYETLLSH